MRYLFMVFVWISIGFGYQIMVYGPDAWTSMLMVGHVLGWPVFFLAWCGLASLWVIVAIGLVLLAIYFASKIGEWRAAHMRRRVLARRAAVSRL